jgi:ATP-binding cassette subfamily B (MDR/TAP) protein 1
MKTVLREHYIQHHALVRTRKQLVFTPKFLHHVLASSSLPAFSAFSIRSASCVIACVNMAPPTPSDGADEKDEASSQVREDDQYLAHTGWKVLFGFTSRSHLPILSCGMLGAGVAAATIPVFAVIYGLIFRDYTDYGAGKIDCSALRSSVTRYCLILTGVAALNWLANSFYFFFFLTFGELQARSARNKIFDALIRKDMAWYDTRETGIAAFLPGIQM